MAERGEIAYTDGRALMQQGAEALHDHVSAHVERAMGQALPQMEVRFQNVSISATRTVTSKRRGDPTDELPTLVNTVRKAFTRFSAKKYTVKKQILTDVNGVFKPGTVTLILGQPGSGKSSLMKALSGRFRVNKDVTFEGEITYNGATREELLNRLPQYVSYVAQRDNHFPTLSVKETLAFAHQCCGGGLSEQDETHFDKGTPEENAAALKAARALYKHYPEVVIHQLGLEDCQDTYVGNTMLRGISGGERKRVTTGEMQFGNKYVTLMDEISTGLDSAATYDIIKTQRSIAKKLHKTVVISLLQPAPEVFELFDDVMMLNDGRVMYHGPRDQVVQYFEGLGFRCPPHRDVADYLLDLGTHKQGQYEALATSPIVCPRTASDFADAFQKSAIHDAMLVDLHSPYDPALLQDKDTHFDHVPEFHQSFWESTWTLTLWQLKVTLRNTAFLKGRAIMVTVMGLVYASVFWQLDPKDTQVVMGVLFSAVLFLALGQASRVPTYLAAREIFYKHRGANFYRTSSYVLACAVSQQPVALAEALVFGSIVYWMCGFVPALVPFILYELLMFLTTLAFASWFFFVAAISPDLHIAKPSGQVSVMFFIMFGGFVITKAQIPNYFIWIYWINPVAWCIRSLSLIQYGDDRFNVDVYDGIRYKEKYGSTMGVYSLGLFDMMTDKVWLGLGFAFMAAACVFFMTLAQFVLEHKRYESPKNISISEDDVEEEVIEATKSNSSVSSSYVRLQSPRNVQRQRDVKLSVQHSTHERHFVPVTLAFKDLWYSVPNPANQNESLDLLKGVSGFARPGRMTALMGSSGAGKTTLMDVIAGRKTGGKIRGDILLNGYPATELAIRRATGYCEQMDVHTEASTFREALTFSAFLRQGREIPDDQKYDSVEECLDLLHLRPIADQIIRGSSVEQMKRLTIGVELAAQPSVLFLDEPTSGLDARSAKVIMDGVRQVADTGRTVVCTIHQPSWEVFGVFDSLLLLKRGGQTVFFGDLGDKATELIEYFEAIPGTPRLEPGYNPATWMLEVIGAGVGNSREVSTDFVDAFDLSKKKVRLDNDMNQEGVSRPAPDSQPLKFTKRRAASELTQAKFVIGRFLHLYWRTPSYSLTRFVVFTILAVIFGLSFVTPTYDTYQGINAGEGMVFITTVFVGVISFNSVLPIASEQRASFYRERASETYNAFWYFMGSTIAEMPYAFGSSLLFISIFFPMAGFTGVGRFLFYWLNLGLHVLLQTYMGQFFAYALPSVEVAAIIGVLINSIFFLFMGFNPPAKFIPSGYKWLYQVVPQRYTLEILSATVFGNCPTDADPNELACKVVRDVPPSISPNLSVKAYVKEVFLMDYEDIWSNFVVILGFIVFFRLLALLSLRFINHQKR